MPPTTNDRSILTPSAALWRRRAENLANFAYERDSKRAAVMVTPLLRLADALASVERAAW